MYKNPLHTIFLGALRSCLLLSLILSLSPVAHTLSSFSSPSVARAQKTPGLTENVSENSHLQVIVQAQGETYVLTDTVTSYSGIVVESLDVIDAVVAQMPIGQLHALQADERIASVTIDAPVHNRENFTTAPVQTNSGDVSLEENGEAPADLLAIDENQVNRWAYSVYLPSTIGGVVNPHSTSQVQIAGLEHRSQLPKNLRKDDTVYPEPAPTPSWDDAFVQAANLQIKANAPVVAIYENGLQNGWRYSATANADIAAKGQVIDSQPSKDEPSVEQSVIEISFAHGWDSFELLSERALESGDFEKLSFWVHGGVSGNQQFWLKTTGTDKDDWYNSDVVITAKAGQWDYYEIPVTSITDAQSFSGLLWQNMHGSSQPAFYIDNVQLLKSRDAEVSAAGVANGLKYRYFRGYWSSLPNFDSMTPTYSGSSSEFTVDAIRDRTNGYGIAYHGFIYVPQDGLYRFYTKSDDGSTLFINNQKVVDNDGIHGLQERGGWIELKSGYHAIEVDYFQMSGSYGLEVGYEGPGTERQVIPASALYPTNPAISDDRGSITREWWTDISGNYISSLEDNANYPAYPSGRDYPTAFEAPLNWDNNYGTRMIGYLHPPVSGWYQFWIAGNNEAKLFLSNDESPGNSTTIAHTKYWTNYEEWTKYSSQTSDLIYLEGGAKYYIEGQQKEGVSGDHLSVAWQVPGGQREVIEGIYLSPFTPQTSNNSTVDPLGYIEALNIDDIHDESVDGGGVDVAYIDTGINEKILDWSYAHAFTDVGFDDKNGHGTFMAGIGHSEKRVGGKYIGVAPDADVGTHAVLDAEGKGTYSRVITGIQGAIDRGADVINMSLQGPVVGPYWENPLNQAVEEAWRQGVVVVVAAGNTGPKAGSVTTPGNDPFVITVGAYTDHYTPDDPNDDYVPPFSAAGPTEMGFVKPDIVAPGGHLVAQLHPDSQLAQNLTPIGDNMYSGAGTSAATAFVSGVVALMLDENSKLTPNEVKYRLLASAKPLVNTTSGSEQTFSIFQQGAGRIDPYEAVFGNYNGSANYDMVPGIPYMGPAQYDDKLGGYYISDGNKHRFFWDGHWTHVGGWSSSAGWSMSAGWSASAGWSSSAGWSTSAGWSASAMQADSNSETKFSNSNYYWNEEDYYAGNNYWAGNDYWTGVFVSNE